MAIDAKTLTEKLMEKNAELASIRQNYEAQVDNLKKENLQLLKQKINMTSDDKYKMVLRLYANGMSVGVVYRIMNEEEGIDIKLDEVRSVIDKVDYLNDDLRKYYAECKKEFLDKINIDKSYFANIIYKKFMLLENALGEQLIKAQELGDDKSVLNCISELKNIYKETANIFFKQGLDSEVDDSLADIEQSYDKLKESKIIKFSKIKVM